MSNRDLYSDGRDVFTWTLENAPIGTPQVEIDGAWHDLVMDDLGGSLNVHGPDCDDPELGSVPVTQSQAVRLQVDDVIRPAGFIRLL
jgi:hypothetical protein